MREDNTRDDVLAQRCGTYYNGVREFSSCLLCLLIDFLTLFPRSYPGAAPLERDLPPRRY